MFRPSGVALLVVTICSSACGDDGVGEPESLHHAAYGVAVSGAGVIALADNANSVVFFGVPGRSAVVTGGTPVHVAFAPNGTIAYATLQSGNALVRVNVHPAVLLKAAPFGHPLYNLLVHPAGTVLYVTTADGWLFRVGASTLAKIDSVHLASASNGLAFGPAATTLYASTILAGRLYQLDPVTLAITDSFTVGSGAQRLAVSPGGDSVYVANENASSVTVVRPSTGAVSNVSIAGTPYGIALSADGTELYVSLRTAGTVVVLDRATLDLVETFAVGGTPRNVAMDPGGDFAVVATEGDIVLLP